ncbi:uncharacterized protein N7458_004991 [Penicillium daleae]|uniref:Uncharacterized protein n=1 Tax=Penicillium daleae TaxID=63821 RepID=A0AAD6C7G1_9EURO|nr:uncharacterized protein N7458_004991 [Penicillium daleae]KAJ5454035.1 hypothetical protein N7458_004991 [Penicillium daleae]
MGSKIRLHSLLSNFASLPARPALGDASVVNQEYDIPTDEASQHRTDLRCLPRPLSESATWLLIECLVGDGQRL